MNYFLSTLLMCFLWTSVQAQYQQYSLNDANWQFKNADKTQWYPATVPGTVHTDLMANRLIPNPFLDENEKKVQWIEEENWVYKTKFKVTKADLKPDQIALVFDGLDTFAKIYLNGELLQTANNMFRQWRIPVKEKLKIGENELKIYFTSNLTKGRKLAKKVPFETPESPRAFIRKAQYQFGWDWGPRLVTVGIWKDVYLESWNKARIANVQIEQTQLSDAIGKLAFNIRLNVDKAGKYTFTLNDKSTTVRLHKGINKVSLPYLVKNPQRWQPNGWGEAKLYNFDLTLAKGSKTLDQRQLRHGFRTVELVQKKDSIGKSFYFKVNGHPLYVKGTNWIPADSFTPRISDEKYETLIEAAAQANMNMIRIWGGGIYEDEAFYKACDENGILVWQDFMFIGSFYPTDSAFLDNVKHEIKYQVERLQNHPSLALWCGNNEIKEAIVNWGYQKKFNYSKADSLKVWADYHKLFEEVIPEKLAEIVPEDKLIYWPSSPSIGWGHQESLEQGDSHYWGVWWGAQPFEVYNQKVGRFMSEYGFQGMPSITAIKSMFSGKPVLDLQNPVIQYHQKHDRGWKLIRKYMTRDYVVPEDFVAYDYVSQLLQARGMRIAIEAHRRNKPYNMGTLIWQLNDCWPVASWSGIDYTGQWKAMHYQAQRSFTTQAIFAFQQGDKLNFYALNDGLDQFKAPKLKLELINFKGKSLKKWTIDYQHDLTTILDDKSLPLQEILKGVDSTSVVLKMKLTDQKGEKLAENLYYFVKPKDLHLPKPQITIKRVDAHHIEISSDVLAKAIYLMGDTHYSENFFDLLPGEIKRIELTKPLQTIKVMSLWETMR